MMACPQASAPRALVYVQHLLGLGHLMRISRIAAALQEAGVETTLVQGGSPTSLVGAAGYDVVQLPSVRVAQADMSLLLNEDGTVFTEADKALRRDRLLATLAAVKPDILLIEAFPFGRRQMRFELLPLLEAARRMKVRVIASSVRDILQVSRKPGRAEETVALLKASFDLVLVHGEAALTPLSRTFPLADRIVDQVVYTGMVGPAAVANPRHDHGVIVSAGGGAVGFDLLSAAISAFPLAAHAGERWLVLAGPHMPRNQYERLAAQAEAVSPLINVKGSVPGLADFMAGARLSVSQAGYNTVADVLAAGCRSVLVPFAGEGETEQGERAGLLAAAGRAVVLEESRLSPESLAQAMRAATALKEPGSPPELNGARRSAQILVQHLHRSDAQEVDQSSRATIDALTAEAAH
jgi:predicted glycosyltransferase